MYVDVWYMYVRYSQEHLSLSIQTLDTYLHNKRCSFSLCLLQSAFDNAHSKNPDAYTWVRSCMPTKKPSKEYSETYSLSSHHRCMYSGRVYKDTPEIHVQMLL